MRTYRLTPAAKAAVVRGNRIIRQRNKLALLDYRGGKCVDCGFSLHQAALEFDHVRGMKEFTIGASGVSSRWNVLAVEADKCDVRCSNCHAIRTHDPEFHAADPFAEVYCS